jgi:hypothetical protein
LLELALGSPSDVDAFVAGIESETGEEIDYDQLVYAVAGREDTVNDPPYLVLGLRQPRDDFHRELVDSLFVTMAGFTDPAGAGRVDRYTDRSLGGKAVYVGTPEMLEQNDHQRGRPYVYEADDYTFLIVTDSDAWAGDAIRQLP